MNETSRNESHNLVPALNAMKDRGKPPRTIRVLNSWIDHMQNEMHLEKTDRLAWLIASTIASAKLQQVLDQEGRPRFLMKGGTLLQHRLDLAARSTMDLDGIIRGDLDEFLEDLDIAMREPWGPVSFSRTEAVVIRVPSKTIKPRRFDMVLSIRGDVWRRVKVEVSAAEGRAGEFAESFSAPRLDGFGIPTPDYLVGMAMSYQAAQKIHGAAGFHEPETGYVNPRARDVVDVLLIRNLARSTGHPALPDIREAAEDTFSVRGEEAQAAGRKAPVWPPLLQAYSHWLHDYQVTARSVGLGLSLEEAVGEANGWIEEIASAS